MNIIESRFRQIATLMENAKIPGDPVTVVAMMMASYIVASELGMSDIPGLFSELAEEIDAVISSEPEAASTQTTSSFKPKLH